MATWITIGQMAAASDPSLADLISTTGTESQTAVDGRIAARAPAIVAQLPQVAAAAAAAVDSALDDASVLTEPDLFASVAAAADFVHALADRDGVPTWARFTAAGLLAPSGAAMLAQAGFPIAVAGDRAGFRIRDVEGRETWLGVDGAGRPDEIARWAIVNAVHYYCGPDEPHVWPGSWVLWDRTDETGLPVERSIGRNQS